MYREPGKTLKVFAWISVVLTVIVFLVVEANGYVIASLLGIDSSPFSILLAGALGFIVGQVGGVLLYAFGELVQSVTALRKKFCGEEQNGLENVPQERYIPLPDEDYVPPKTKRGNDGSWCCPVCDQLNAGKNDRCEHCSTKVAFE